MHTRAYHCVFGDTFSGSHGFFAAVFFSIRRENEVASLGSHYHNAGKGYKVTYHAGRRWLVPVPAFRDERGNRILSPNP